MKTNFFLEESSSLLCAHLLSTADKVEVRAALPMAKVPENEKWKLGELDNLLLGERVGLEKEGQDVKRVVSMFMLCL